MITLIIQQRNKQEITQEHTMDINYTYIFIAIFSTALVILLERAFPFILFSKKNPPAIITFIEKYIPPMVMAALLFYCIKDINFVKQIDSASETFKSVDWHGFIPYLVSVSATIGLHLWKRNSLLSIFGGTGIYMILIRIL